MKNNDELELDFIAMIYQKNEKEKRNRESI